MQLAIPECLRLLDVTPDATLEEVRASYRLLVKVWHPDRHHHDPKLQAHATKKLAEINQAYETLVAALHQADLTSSSSCESPPSSSEVRCGAPEAGGGTKTHPLPEGVEEHLDEGKSLHRFALTTRKPGCHLDAAGYHFERRFTRWVALNVSRKEATAMSRSFQVECHAGNPVGHYDYVGGGYTWEYAFPDGSGAEAGFQPEHLTDSWRAHVDAGRLDQSLRVAEEVVRLHPAAPEAHILRAFSLHALRRSAEAKQVLLSVAGKFPDNRTIAYNLACYECALGNLANAKSWLKQAKRISGKESIRRRALNDPDLAPLRTYILGPIWW